MAPFYGVVPLKNPFKYENGATDSTCYGARLGCKFHSFKKLESKILIYNCISFISVSRTKWYHYTYDTDPYLWESDKSPINFTFADFTWEKRLYADSGVSSGFQGYQVLGGGWMYPKPETGNEMFISFYNSYKTTKCPLYCEKSGIFVTIILITRVYNIP